ncbi:MAG: hypothetical protein H8D95_01260 [Candidatus Endolissoclinum sp.]|nr:hypothetical protein [Candidatus Endolissoclinum sp.]
MNKTELIHYINKHTTGKIAGRKEITISDIFISTLPSQFRVSALGRDTLKKHFKTYNIELKLTSATMHQHRQNAIGTGNQILALDKYLHTPYYLRKSRLILFEEVAAAELLMIDGDIDLWVQNKTFYNTSKT